MRSMIIMLTGAALLAACDGTAENAGEIKDAENGQAVAIGEGPAERMGERIDRARDSAEDAVEAQADALRDKADLDAEKLEAHAHRLEARADAVRDEAKLIADAIEKEVSR